MMLHAAALLFTIVHWATNSSDPGLHGQSGIFLAVAPTANEIAANPNYKGHIQTVANQRYLSYSNGEPFFKRNCPIT